MERISQSLYNRFDGLACRVDSVLHGRLASPTGPLWHPLDRERREIRLLSLEPNEKLTSRVRCSLRIVRLNDAPDYEAISYTWGDVSRTVAGHVDGHVRPINANLDCALRHLRHKKTPVWLWADGLCIAQDNLQEKGYQVQMIADIFSKASVVRAFVGPQECNSDRAVQILQAVSETSDLNLATLIVEGRSICADDLLSLAHLFRRPYWHRAWIAQELLLARRSTIQCGFKRIKRESLPSAKQFYKCLENSFEHFQSRGHYKQWSQAVSGLSDNLLTLLDVLARSKKGLWEDTPGRSTSALITLCDQDATVAHDYVYAFRGLFWPRLQARVIPNYTSSLGVVYKDFAQAWIEDTQGTDVSLLHYASGVYMAGNSPVPELPSWAPWLRKGVGNESKRSAMWRLFDLNTDIQQDISRSSDGNIMLIASALDNVTDTMILEDETPHYAISDRRVPYQVDLDVFWHSHNRWRSFFDLPEHCNGETRYFDLGLLEDVYWQTVNILPDLSKYQSTLKQIAACKTWLTLANKNQSATQGLDDDSWETVAFCHENCPSRCDGRYLFKTASGYIGRMEVFGDSPVQPNDMVYFVARAFLPFILRPVGVDGHGHSRLKVVGSAYMYGLVDPIIQNEDGTSVRVARQAGQKTHIQTARAKSWEKICLI